MFNVKDLTIVVKRMALQEDRSAKGFFAFIVEFLMLVTDALMCSVFFCDAGGLAAYPWDVFLPCIADRRIQPAVNSCAGNGRCYNRVMCMKDLRKGLGLLAAGWLAAVFLYPLLHELGHAAAAAAFNFRILELRLLPLPSLACEMDCTNRFAMAAVGFGGMLLPYLLSLIPPKKHFWPWYLWMVISGICLLSFAISMAGIVRFKAGAPIQNDDITQIMASAGEYGPAYLALLTGLSIFRINQVIRTRPLRRCLREFGLQ